MSSPHVIDIARAFNARHRQEFIRIPRVITARNDWHISIRLIPIEPPRHVVYFLHLQSRCFGHSEPIETAMGHQLGDIADWESESAILEITRLILLQFISPGFQVGKPWSWSTNNRALAERVTRCLVTLDVEQSLVELPVGWAWENELSDYWWAKFLVGAPGLGPRHAPLQAARQASHQPPRPSPLGATNEASSRT